MISLRIKEFRNSTVTAKKKMVEKKASQAFCKLRNVTSCPFLFLIQQCFETINKMLRVFVYISPQVFAKHVT